MRFLLIFLLISTTAFAKDKIYTCKPIAAAAVTKSGQIYAETLADMDEEAGLLSVVPESQFLISKEEGFFYKNPSVFKVNTKLQNKVELNLKNFGYNQRAEI